MDLLPTNAAHWHLVLNHLPVVGSLAALLLLTWAFIKNTDESKRIALAAVVILALVSIPAFLTGEPSERFLKGLPGISKRWMSSHEEMAENAMKTAVIAGVLALAALVYFRKARSIPRWAMAVVLAATVAVAGSMSITARHGGKIHHPEILNGAATETAPTEIEH
ncbi:MAG: hypothetical protein RLY20_1497 [Verrucomicrobiota bacterium]|jgi:hypothetical protein